MCVCMHVFKLLLTFSHQSRSDTIILKKKSGKMTYTHTHTHTCTHSCTHTHMYTNFLDKSNGKVCTGQVSLAGLKMPAYTKRVNKTFKSFKKSTTCYTKADNTLYSTNSHLKKRSEI